MSERNDVDRIAVWDGGDILYIAALPRGPITVLEGTAVTIWLAATAGPIEDAADRVALEMALEVDEIRGSVDEFVDRLISQGLIARTH